METLISIIWIGLLIWSIGGSIGIIPAPIPVRIIGNVILKAQLINFFLWILNGICHFFGWLLKGIYLCFEWFLNGIYQGLCAVF